MILKQNRGKNTPLPQSNCEINYTSGQFGGTFMMRDFSFYLFIAVILIVIGLLDRIVRIIPFLKDSYNTLIFVITEPNVKRE